MHSIIACFNACFKFASDKQSENYASERDCGRLIAAPTRCGAVGAGAADTGACGPLTQGSLWGRVDVGIDPYGGEGIEQRDTL